MKIKKKETSVVVICFSKCSQQVTPGIEVSGGQEPDILPLGPPGSCCSPSGPPPRGMEQSLPGSSKHPWPTQILKILQTWKCENCHIRLSIFFFSIACSIEMPGALHTFTKVKT